MRGSLLLGILGFIFGILCTFIYFVIALGAASIVSFLSPELKFEEAFTSIIIVASLAIVASILGIVGAAKGRKFGGILMIISGILVLLFLQFIFGIIPGVLFIIGGFLALKQGKKTDRSKYRAGIQRRIVIRPVTSSSEVVCRNCGNLMPLGSRKCSSCGTKLYEDVPGPRCPICGAPLAYGTRTSPTTVVCGICFSELRIERISESVCPRCGSRNVIDCGNFQKCNDCGLKFIKD